MDNSLPVIRNKTINSVFKVMGEMADAIFSWVSSINKDLTRDQDISDLYEKMKECVNPKGGEIKARYNTISLGNLYLNLSDVGKVAFLKLLEEKFSADRVEIDEKVGDYIREIDEDGKRKCEFQLMTVLESPRLRILKQFISLPDGLKFIVDMRSDVIRLNKNQSFFSLEKDLRNILSYWFDIGLLDLHQITWDSPASLLEKLILYEAVHAISSWDDLRDRLDSDRRCFSFFHYKMSREPLIFVEVALVDEIATSIQMLLDSHIPAKDPKNAKVAIFYSISNTQKGLSGISLGNFLIKRVVNKLSEEFQSIKIYATLSPIPGFVKWIMNTLPSHVELLNELKIAVSIDEIISYVNARQYADLSQDIKNLFLKLCAYYLVKAKNTDRALDPVAHFHLSNGAIIKQLNWMADISEKGLNNSMGIMVNYHYELSKIDDNYENYVINREINCSKEVLSLLKR
ncbi:malonyl-CoA decarboxylase family protein [Ehrlichia chaffeensis str. Heartland]|uniref:Malonyl-CoA decarboxylase n=1 Tax=Ehrlichia chaffeensis (strain ATCC CRL-10679 / Arkansas) TaxID=205920 RepID=Q2GG23_EHRCR|nr:malonyl-CoA decarboxylase [Ehrlichia chaffeensis]ABD44519.1 putative malonyl-CoA decarboxylase [Ehrlichia chaffeensis str. Arkansas]AHX03869.1 malonyl-CoA decarboxylase family protein [Ehrlichia chaffeensis str. Heartland]AHX05405.1 malonyl-CoA decarboxylase family protein [Ehrlichia chaffeensis str. Jax]AHX06392.1 malonyl-CoA decarboxylase family protein [Ehrlichia chaffeensis str. Liberty]AHX07090.1 malonyl-CoA decarboxylase family protein [Ehrlichia chaffeensis str. Osceola]